MLRPAQLYKEELNRKYIETWYNPKYMYYSGGTGTNEIQLSDNNYEKHQFVYVDKNNEVTGFFNYSVNWEARSVHHFGLISFVDGNVLFMRDVIKHLEHLLEDVGMNRIEFWAYKDNPAVKGYDKLVKKYGGSRIGELHKCDLLIDGKLHDMVGYEILRNQGMLNKLPADDVEPVKHGRWRRLTIFSSHYIECSECGWGDNVLPQIGQYRYCPYCGAKMGDDSDGA